MWFGRSGSIVTVAGLLITLKHSILSNKRTLDDAVMERNRYAKWAPDDDSPEYIAAVAEAKRVLRDEKVGLFLTVIGTAIWGYGDLLSVCAA